MRVQTNHYRVRKAAMAILFLVLVSAAQIEAAVSFYPIRRQLIDDISRLEATNHLTKSDERSLQTMRRALAYLDSDLPDEQMLWLLTRRLSQRQFPAYESAFVETAAGLAAALHEEMPTITNEVFDLPPSAAARVAQRRAGKLLRADVRHEAATNVWRRAPLLYRARLAHGPAYAATQRAITYSNARLELRLRFAPDHSYVSNGERFRFNFSQLFVDSEWQRDLRARRTPTNMFVWFSCTFGFQSSIAVLGYAKLPHEQGYDRVTLEWQIFTSRQFWGASDPVWTIYTSRTYAWGTIFAEGELALAGEFSIRFETPEGDQPP